MAKTPEGKVKDAIKAFLKSLPGCWFFMPVSNGMGAHGVPDFIGVYRGRFFAIEAKAPGKEKNTTPLQDRVIGLIRAAGGHVVVASDLQTVKVMFTSINFRAAA